MKNFEYKCIYPDNVVANKKMPPNEKDYSWNEDGWYERFLKKRMEWESSCVTVSYDTEEERDKIKQFMYEYAMKKGLFRSHGTWMEFNKIFYSGIVYTGDRIRIEPLVSFDWKSMPVARLDEVKEDRDSPIFNKTNAFPDDQERLSSGLEQKELCFDKHYSIALEEADRLNYKDKNTYAAGYVNAMTKHKLSMEDNREESLEDVAKSIQQECHRTVEAIMKESKKPINYQDATNVFLFKKLAELEIKLNRLTEK